MGVIQWVRKGVPGRGSACLNASGGSMGHRAKNGNAGVRTGF